MTRTAVTENLPAAMTKALGLVVSAYVVWMGILQPLAVKGIAPDPVMLVIVAAGCAGGPVVGAGTGFGAGLLLDATPNAVHPAGIGALACTIAGYLIGLVLHGDRPGWVLSDRRIVRSGALFAGTVCCGLLAAIVFAGLGAFTGRADGDVASIMRSGLSVAVVSAVFAPLLVPPLLRIIRG